MANERDGEAPANASAGGTAPEVITAQEVNQLADEVVRLRRIEAAAKVFIGRTASIGEDHPAYGFVVMGLPLAKALAGDTAVVDFALDRAATWRALDIDPEQAERDNCWQAPSVASALNRLKAIETAAVAYRDAVLIKREREAAVAGKLVLSPEGEAYRAARDDKKVKGEALFALLDGVSPEFAAATEAQRRVEKLLLPVQREALAEMIKRRDR